MGKKKKEKVTTKARVLEFFKKRRRVGALLTVFKGKMVKVKKSGQDGAKKKMVELCFNVRIVKNILSGLGTALSQVLEAAGCGENTGRHDLSLNSIDLTHEFVCILRVFGSGNYSENSEPIFICGGQDDGAARCTVKRILIKDGIPYLRLCFDVCFTQKIWSWGGDNYGGDTNCVIEMEPFQRDLDFEAEESEGEDGKSEEKPNESRTGLREVVDKGEAVINGKK